MKPLEDLDFTKKKVIIFDLDGTLIDSIGIWNQTDAMMIKKWTGKEVSLEKIQVERDAFLETHQGCDIYAAYCTYLIQKYQIDISAEVLLSDRWDYSNAFLKEKIDYKEKADLVLQKFKKMGYAVALGSVTSNVQLDIYRNENQNIKSKADFLDIFDCMISKDHVHNKKPHPEVYLKVMNYFQVKPSECLVFEDSYLGVLAAKRAGIEVVNVYDSYADIDRDRINEKADYQIQEYGEILNQLEKIESKKLLLTK